MPRTLADDRVRGVIVDADTEQTRFLSGHASGAALAAYDMAEHASWALGAAARLFEQAERNRPVNRAVVAADAAKVEVAVRALADRWAAIADSLAREPNVEVADAEPERVAA